MLLNEWDHDVCEERLKMSINKGFDSLLYFFVWKKYFSYGFGILHLKGDAWEPVTGLMAGDFNASHLYCSMSIEQRITRQLQLGASSLLKGTVVEIHLKSLISQTLRVKRAYFSSKIES